MHPCNTSAVNFTKHHIANNDIFWDKLRMPHFLLNRNPCNTEKLHSIEHSPWEADSYSAIKKSLAFYRTQKHHKGPDTSPLHPPRMHSSSIMIGNVPPGYSWTQIRNADTCTDLLNGCGNHAKSFDQIEIQNPWHTMPELFTCNGRTGAQFKADPVSQIYAVLSNITH